MKEETLLDRLVKDLNETLWFNSKDKQGQLIFTLDRKYWQVGSYPNGIYKNTSNYRIILNHHEAGVLILQSIVLEGIKEESEDTWLILEEQVIKELAKFAVFGVGNLIEQTKRLQRRY